MAEYTKGGADSRKSNSEYARRWRAGQTGRKNTKEGKALAKKQAKKKATGNYDNMSSVMIPGFRGKGARRKIASNAAKARWGKKKK